MIMVKKNSKHLYSFGEKFQDSIGGRIHLRQLEVTEGCSLRTVLDPVHWSHLSPPGLENILEYCIQSVVHVKQNRYHHVFRIRLNPQLGQLNLNFNTPRSVVCTLEVVEAV